MTNNHSHVNFDVSFRAARVVQCPSCMGDINLKLSNALIIKRAFSKNLFLRSKVTYLISDDK